MPLAITLFVTAVLLVLLVSVALGSPARVRHAHRRIGTGDPTPDPAELTPEELAFLAGGPERMAQVSLLRLYLTGRIRRQHGGTFTVVGTARSPRRSDGPMAGTILRIMRGRVTSPAKLLIRRAAGGRNHLVVQQDLARAGLHIGPEWDRALRDHAGATKVLRLLAVAGAAVLVATLVWAGPPGTAAADSGLATGGVLLVGGILMPLLGRAAGRASGATAAGRDVLAKAHASMDRSFREAGTEADRRTAQLRYAALHGLTPTHRRRRRRSGQGGGDTTTVYAADPGTPAMADDPRTEVHGFADHCAQSPDPSGSWGFGGD
ncbi:TIGR04222 domain-containing membrane protein [Marinitenerispora sediminis]|nr:TIGR04222 domain-containing membrane protein [Marinitenerispora sediminis]